MSRKKLNKNGAGGGGAASGPGRDASKPVENQPDRDLHVSEWKSRQAAVWRKFPGPATIANVPLRVAMERAAYGEVVAHAKESLDAEICGALVGTACEDDDGPFVHIQAAVRGAKAREAAAHVTFTQETWNSLHATIEREYQKLQIVGWYHSHPGFGVEFSEMDVFIQKNFFGAPSQVGLVTDPLGGTVAICINAKEGIRYLDRFWVDAREQRCQVPSSGSSAAAAPPEAGAQLNSDLEARVSQLIKSVDELRGTFYFWMTTLGMLAALAFMFFIARQIHGAFYGIPELPKAISFAPVPVLIDGKPCLLGVNIVKWSIPNELIALPKPGETQTDEKKPDEEKKADGKQAPQPDSPKPLPDRKKTNDPPTESGK